MTGKTLHNPIDVQAHNLYLAKEVLHNQLLLRATLVDRCGNTDDPAVSNRPRFSSGGTVLSFQSAVDLSEPVRMR